jgi:hypothetical protein
VGKNSAVIVPASGADGLTIASGEIYLRGISIQGTASSGIGINAAPTGGNTVTLHMDSCAVSNNGGGGILLNGAAFDIKNTTITGNRANIDSTPWGGIYVQSLPASGPMILDFVTIQNNLGPGLVCALTTAIQGTGILATGNMAGEITTSCSVTSCSASDASASCGAQSAP